MKSIFFLVFMIFSLPSLAGYENLKIEDEYDDYINQILSGNLSNAQNFVKYIKFNKDRRDHKMFYKEKEALQKIFFPIYNKNLEEAEKKIFSNEKKVKIIKPIKEFQGYVFSQVDQILFDKLMKIPTYKRFKKSCIKYLKNKELKIGKNKTYKICKQEINKRARRLGLGEIKDIFDTFDIKDALEIYFRMSKYQLLKIKAAKNVDKKLKLIKDFKKYFFASVFIDEVIKIEDNINRKLLLKKINSLKEDEIFKYIDKNLLSIKYPEIRQALYKKARMAMLSSKEYRQLSKDFNKCIFNFDYTNLEKEYPLLTNDILKEKAIKKILKRDDYGDYKKFLERAKVYCKNFKDIKMDTEKIIAILPNAIKYGGITRENRSSKEGLYSIFLNSNN